MSTTTSTSPKNRSSLLLLSLIGGVIIGLLHIVIQLGIVFSLLGGTPLMSILQYIASGIMGEAAYAGGIGTALLGLVLEFVMTIIIAGIFVFSADRISLLRNNVIVGSLLYGFGVFVVMNFIVVPLSAAAILPPPTTWMLIEIILEHMLLIGLPLGILVKRNVSVK
jgi:hypothetical protein